MATTTIRLGAGTIALEAGALDLGPEVMYATVEGGRVTAVLFGELPESDDATLYVDVSGLDPLPAVDDYFADVCQTFSSLPPVIPAGDAAPPFTPGGTPPTPGGPEYPPPELDPGDDVPVFAPLAPTYVSFHADGADPISFTGTGAGLEEVDARLRTVLRLTDVCAARLQAHVATEGALELFLCFRNELDEWEELAPEKTGPKVDVSAAGTYAGFFRNIDPVATGDVLVTVCAKGTGSVVLGNVLALLLYKAGEGVCVEIDEVTGCGLFGFPDEGTDFDYPTYADFLAALPLGNLFNYWGGPDPEDPAYVSLESDAFGKHMLLQHGFGGSPRNVYWWTTFASASNQRAAFMVTAIDPALASQTGDGLSTDQQGLVLFKFYNAAWTLQIQLRNDRIYALINNAQTDLGPASDLADGTPKQVICEVDVFSDGGLNSASLNLYIDEPCLNAPPTVYGSATSGLVSGTIDTEITLLVVNEWFDLEETGEQRVYLYAVGIQASNFHD